MQMQLQKQDHPYHRVHARIPEKRDTATGAIMGNYRRAKLSGRLRVHNNTKGQLHFLWLVIDQYQKTRHSLDDNVDTRETYNPTISKSSILAPVGYTVIAHKVAQSKKGTR